VVLHRFGMGRVVYCASLVETIDGLDHTFISLLQRLVNTYSFEAEAPACVEITLFHQPERRRYLLSLINFQKEMPNLPVNAVSVRLRLPSRVQGIQRLPGGQRVDYQEEGGVVSFVTPKLEALLMLAVELT
jgi:hypothetical protein